MFIYVLDILYPGSLNSFITILWACKPVTSTESHYNGHSEYLIQIYFGSNLWTRVHKLTKTRLDYCHWMKIPKEVRYVRLFSIHLP